MKITFITVGNCKNKFRSSLTLLPFNYLGNRSRIRLLPIKYGGIAYRNRVPSY